MSRPRKRGPSHTPPAVRAPDIRDGSLHPPDLLSRLRDVATIGRLGLGGAARAPVPSALHKTQYLCDQDDLTAYAGMFPFMQFAYQAGLADWVAAVPIKRRCDTIYRPGKLCEVIVAMAAAGLERVSHIDDVKDDPGLCAMLGLDRLPDQATLSRFFSDATPAAVEYLQSVNRAFADHTVSFSEQQSRLIVDVDTRDMMVYGKQENTVASPRKNGNRIYTFEVATLRNSRDILGAELLRGATHPAPLFAKRFAGVLSQVSSQAGEVVFCADAAWYAGYVAEQIEQADKDAQVACRCKYAIRAQMRNGLKRAISSVSEEAWSQYDNYMEVAEVEFAFTETRDADGRHRRGKHPQRRYIITRRERDTPKGEQETLIEVPRYEYGAIITNLDWAPKRIVKLYNSRATVESILKESALGFHIDSLPSAKFSGNRVFCQLLVLAHNLVNLFRRLCAPDENKRQYVSGIRRQLLRVPGRVESDGDTTVVRCALCGPHVVWFDCVIAAFRQWLRPPPVAQMSTA